MSTPTAADSVHAAAPSLVASEYLQDRLAEAARYAVLRRIAPVLRHDVAGFMQPVGMLTKVLQRRVQMPGPDLQAIAKDAASISALAKDATTGCMNALGWMASRDDAPVNLCSSVNEAATLLAMDLAAQGLEIRNIISDDALAVPQSFFRSVLVGALLAFCDQCIAGGTLQISVSNESENVSTASELMLRMLPDEARIEPPLAEFGVIDRPSRRIDWPDVEAMAASFGVAIARGDGWLTVGLPKLS